MAFVNLLYKLVWLMKLVALQVSRITFWWLRCRNGLCAVGSSILYAVHGVCYWAPLRNWPSVLISCEVWFVGTNRLICKRTVHYLSSVWGHNELLGLMTSVGPVGHSWGSFAWCLPNRHVDAMQAHLSVVRAPLSSTVYVPCRVRLSFQASISLLMFMSHGSVILD